MTIQPFLQLGNDAMSNYNPKENVLCLTNEQLVGWETKICLSERQWQRSVSFGQQNKCSLTKRFCRGPTSLVTALENELS